MPRATWQDRVDQGIDWRDTHGRVRTSMRRNGAIAHIHPVRDAAGNETIRWWHEISIRHPSDPTAHDRYGVRNPGWTGHRRDNTLLLEGLARSARNRSGTTLSPTSTHVVLDEVRSYPLDRRVDQFEDVRDSFSLDRRTARRPIYDPAADDALLDQVEPRNPSLTRSFGVEIECLIPDVNRFLSLASTRGLAVANESYNHHTRSYWKLTTDASVLPRTHQGVRYHGRELVSPPLSGEHGFEQLKLACEVLVEAGARVTRNCGLHVHLDAADLSAQDVMRIITGYTGARNAIDSILPASRRHNDFCQHYNNVAFDIMNNTGQYLNYWPTPCRTIQDIATRLTSRYYTVNLQAYPRHRTIEFRQHSGSIEWRKISAWIRLCQSVVTTAREARPFGETLTDLLDNLRVAATDRSYFIRRAEHLTQVARTTATRRARAAAR